MLKKKFLTTVLAASLLLSVLPAGASAADDGWEFTLSPYLWLVGIDGEVTLGRETFEPSVSFGDIWDNLDFALQGYFEASKGKFGLFLDPTYLNLSIDRTVAGVERELESTSWLVEFGGLYELWAGPMGEGREASFSLLGGGRYFSQDNEIKLGSGISLASDSESVVDPIIGARFTVDLHEKVPCLLRGDIGGFGVGSEAAWQIQALLGYRFTPSMTLWAGYRVLDIDVEEGDRDSRFFESKVTLSGPIVGFAFAF
jgi:hypothetical protein